MSHPDLTPEAEDTQEGKTMSHTYRGKGKPLLTATGKISCQATVRTANRRRQGIVYECICSIAEVNAQGDEVTPYILYCPLHAAAPALLEASKKMIARSQELPQDRSIPFAPELVIIAEAIAQADLKWFKQYAEGR